MRTRPDEDPITRLIRQGRDREAADLASARLAATTGGDPMDPIAQLDQITPLLGGLVAGLDDQQLARPTTCDKFDVRGVLEHMVGGAAAFTAAFRGEEPPAPSAPADVVEAFPRAMKELCDAMRAPGALERTIQAPFGEVPGEVFARFVAFDGLVHGWDIATATAQAYDPPADVVAEVEQFAAQAITDPMRDGDTFKAATQPPAGSTALQRVVAFSGRPLA